MKAYESRATMGKACPYLPNFVIWGERVELSDGTLANVGDIEDGDTFAQPHLTGVCLGA